MINKYKYDVLRHALRTELAQGNLYNESKIRLAAALESVRDKSESECKVLANSYATIRANIRSQTGSNGETPSA